MNANRIMKYRDGVARFARCALGAAIVATVVISSPLHAAGSVWRPRAPMPVGVAGFAHAVIDGRIVVAGGTTWQHGAKSFSREVWAYDPAANRWISSGELERAFAFGGFAARLKAPKMLWLLGGDDGVRTRADALAFPFPATSGSSKAVRGQPMLQLSLPEPLAYVGSASDDQSIYLLGGTTDLHDLTRLRPTFLRVDRATGRIVRLPNFPGGAVMHAALVVVNGDVLVFPGGKYDAAHHHAVNTSAAWRFHRQSRTWHRITDYPLHVRGLAVCAIGDSQVLLAGGYVTSGPAGAMHETAKCLLYDATDDRYREIASLPFAAMLIGLERIGGTIYAFGGEDRGQHRATNLCASDLEQLVK